MTQMECINLVVTSEKDRHEPNTNPTYAYLKWNDGCTLLSSHHSRLRHVYSVKCEIDQMCIRVFQPHNLAASLFLSICIITLAITKVKSSFQVAILPKASPFTLDLLNLMAQSYVRACEISAGPPGTWTREDGMLGDSKVLESWMISRLEGLFESRLMQSRRVRKVNVWAASRMRRVEWTTRLNGA